MNIGKRQRIDNLRNIWLKETDFSDWLVTEDGLQLIAEDLGIEVEDPRREQRPGDFPCDIVAHVAGDENHVVIIENQFGKTNHDHLGKLLTYASVNDATTAIWLSEEVSDDHRKVIDWLNDNTPPHLSFFLAQIKAHRIGNSPVAPELDVISRPNLEVKVRREATSEELKSRHIWRKAMWEDILSYIKSQRPPFNVQSPGVDHWSAITLGRSGFHLALTLTPKRQCVGCELYFQVPWKDAAWTQLYAQRTAVEAQLGSTLQWQPLAGKKSARILLETPLDPRDEGNHHAIREWMHHTSVSFYNTFKPRVLALQKPTSSEQESSDSDDLINDSEL